jgi:AraC-like DNA-binding protein/predicted transcriptional regulator YdeE
MLSLFQEMMNGMIAWQAIQASVDWIEEHLADELSIRTLARTANLSPYYFQRLFRKLVGKTVMAYVRLRRLAKVSDRLVFNDDSILNSCYHYGFESHEAFSRAFKDEYGITPTEFRKYAKTICRFPKPVLTEKGLYVMDYEVQIEELGALDFLAIPHLALMDDSREAIEESKQIWNSCFKDAAIDQLKAVCGTETLYALFCDTYNPDTKRVSYDIGCINQLKAASAAFRAITLRPSKYAVVSGTYKAPMTMGQVYARFNAVFWDEWLPKTNYRSVLDTDWLTGSASIELYTPPDVDAAEFSVKIWYPIAEK